MSRHHRNAKRRRQKWAARGRRRHFNATRIKATGYDHMWIEVHADPPR